MHLPKLLTACLNIHDLSLPTWEKKWGLQRLRVGTPSLLCRLFNNLTQYELPPGEL